MSLFNEFNFNESSFNDTSGFVGGSIVEISASISTDSDVSGHLSIISHINSAIDTSSSVVGEIVSESLSVAISTESSVYGILNAVDMSTTIYESNSEIVAFLGGEFTLASDVTGSSDVSGSPENICNTQVAIDTSSLVVGGFGLLRGHITESDSLVESFLHIIHGIASTGISESESSVSGDSSVTHDASGSISTETTITSPTCYYDTSSEVCINEPVLSRTLEGSASIDTSSSVNEPDLELYFRLFNNTDDVTGSSDVSGTIYYVRGAVGNIDTESSVTGRIVYDTNCGGANIETGSELPFDFGEINIRTGSTVNGILDAPTQLFKKRREVTYIFEVDRNRNPKSIIDNHYNIMKFYYSLSGIDEVLEYTRRNAQKDLNSYKIPDLIQLISDYNEQLIDELPAPFRIWSSDSDLRNINTGDRGMVQSKAVGQFTLKDGHFALYRGPKYVDGQLVEN